MNEPSIDQLVELSLPAPPTSYWPQTWGWLLLALLLLAALLVVGIWRYRRWQRDSYRREALHRLDQLTQALADPQQRLGALRELPQLLKRVALSIPQAQAAALRTEAWQAFLQRHSRQPLPVDFAEQLADLAYAPASRLEALADEQVQCLLRQIRQWIRGHHVAV